MQNRRTLRITETPDVPPLGLVLGFGAMIPIVAGTALVCLLPNPTRGLVRDETLLWSSAMLFLSGVRRGISFRTPSGPTSAQLATMLWLFVLGLASLTLIPSPIASALLIASYLSIAVLDPIAARNQQAPLFLARLRPAQMAIPVISLIVLGALSYV